MSRTVTKVIFHDSSDDEGDTRPAGTTTTFVDVRSDNLCMDEDDLVCPEEHFLRCDEYVGEVDDTFVEDALPDLEKAKGTLAINHANTVEVSAMAAPSQRTGGFAPRLPRPGRRPENAASAHSTRKRLRGDSDDDEEGTDAKQTPAAAATAEADGMTTDEMIAAAEGHGLPAPSAEAVGALDAVEGEVVKAVLLPNGTHRDPLAIKVSTEGYRLSLDEHDVQDVFEDEDDGDAFDEEEEEEEDAELQLLMAVSAIEQLIGACERYQPNEADGGMCPWAEEAEAAAAAEGSTAAASAEPSASAAAAAAPPATAVDAAPTAEEPVADEEAATEEGAVPPTKRLIHRPRIFDSFVEKGRALLAQLQASEITGDDLMEALEEDIDAVQRAFRRINRPVDAPIYIDGVKMDF